MHRLAVAIALFAVTACSSAPQSGALLPGTPAAHSVRSATRSSWMNALSTSKALLYATSYDASYFDGSVQIYTYPGLARVGALGPFQIPAGLCTDTVGDVYVTDFGNATITEFAHGSTTPIRTLHESGSPNSCAVEATTGDLAVANPCGYNSKSNCAGPGSLVIFDRSNHVRVKISTPGVSPAYCGYGPHGELYVDGGGLSLAVLPKRSKKLQTIALDQSLDDPGSVQWDGAHMTIQDENVDRQPSVSYIYRLKIQGLTATTVGTTTLSSPTGEDSGFNASWIQGSSVIATILTDDFPVSDGAVYAYPGGGGPKAGFGGLEEAAGVAVSVARP